MSSTTCPLAIRAGTADSGSLDSFALFWDDRLRRVAVIPKEKPVMPGGDMGGMMQGSTALQDPGSE
ncbi:MAG: hypothetical protein PVJ33_12205 [Lysobacterales bacterium]|jgi:hypothetical protein